MKAHPLLIILFSLSSLRTLTAKEPSLILKKPDFPDPEQPLLPETPTSQFPPPPPPPPPPTVPSTRANGTNPIIPIPPQPEKPTKKVAIVISVGIVTLGMLSAFLFYLFKHRRNYPIDTLKLVGTGDSPDQTRIAPPATFLYIGTMEPANNRLQTETTVTIGSPYRKLNSDHHPRYRPSPEIQPLPPLSKPPANFFPAVDHLSSSEDDNREKTAFYTQNDSSTSNDEGSYTPASNSWTSHRAFPNSKQNSSKSRFSISSPEKENSATLRPPPLPMGRFQNREQIFWHHSRRLAPRRPPLPRREPETMFPSSMDSRSRSEPESEAETTASSVVGTHTGEEEDEGPKFRDCSLN